MALSSADKTRLAEKLNDLANILLSGAALGQALVLLLPQHAHAYYTNMPASVVIGQQDFSSNGSNQGGNAGANTVSNPWGAFTDGTRLLIADSTNNRVLVYNQLPTSNNAPADIVIGQPDMNTVSAGTSASKFNSPNAAYIDPVTGKLFIVDYGNHRLLIYNHIPTTNGEGANVVVGQPNFNSSAWGVLNSRLFFPYDVVVAQGKLIVADAGDDRVSIWNTIPTTNGAPMDVVIGQTSTGSVTFVVSACTSVTSTTMNLPEGVEVDKDGHLYIADQQNSRILIYNSIPTTSGAVADKVMGQPNFTTCNSNPVSSASLNGPSRMRAINNQLFLSDTSNQRILVSNTLPANNQPQADMVIGQPNFTSNSANQGLPTPASTTFWAPYGLAIDPGRKFMAIAEYMNNRVLIFSNQLPDVSLTRTISGQPNGKLRFSGTASTNVVNGIVKQVEYSVNGGTWTGGFPTDGKFDSAIENYYFDFDPHVNTMASPPSPEASASQGSGYTVKIRSTHNNDIDTSKATLYFEPFLVNSPLDNTFTLNRLPSFTFSVQKLRFSDLKENLDHFRVMVKKDGSDWQPYVDFIPVDYNLVRLHPDNLQPNKVDTMNGTYEDKSKTVTYEKDNSVVTVQPKAVDSQGNASDKYWENGGKLLSNATYQWKVQAEDHAGQIQETDPRTIRIGTRQVITSRPYFPLSITGVGGINGTVNLSTNNPNQPQQPFTVNTRWPTFAGIAVSGATVTLQLRDTSCTLGDAALCTKTYDTTVKPDSTFRKTIPKALTEGTTYEVTASVKDSGDNYNELPTFTVNVGKP